MADKQYKIDIIANARADVSQLKNALKGVKVSDELEKDFTKAFVNIEKQFDKIQKSMNEGFSTKGSLNSFKKDTKELESLIQGLFKNLNGKTFDFKLSPETSKQIQQYNEQIQALKKQVNSINFKPLEDAISKYNSKSGAKANALAIINDKDLDNLDKIKALTPILEQWNKRVLSNGKSSAAAKQQVQNFLNLFKDATKNVKPASDAISQAEKEIEKLEKAAQERGMQDFVDILQRAANTTEPLRRGLDGMADSQQRFNSELDNVKNRIKYFFGLENAINLARRAIQNAFNTIKDLDKAMTETAVVTDFSVGDMWDKLPQYTETANKLGATIQGAYETMTLFYQQGLNTNQAFEIGTETMKMARIAGLDYANATDLMTAALRGFNMELDETSAKNINDVYSNLAAITASDTEELGIAMSKVASIAHSANMEFENTSAFLAQILEVTREAPETAGTALKTVIARFSEVKKMVDEGLLTGEDEEGEVIDVNKIQAALRTAGVDMSKFFLGEQGLDEIFIELANKWDSLTTVQQRYIATQAAGSRQQSRFLALMQDSSRLTELTSAAYTSAGASEVQFGKTMESLEAKLNKLTNAWNSFTMGIANNDVIKTAVDLITDLITGVNKLTDVLPGPASGLAKIAVGLAGIKGGGKVFDALFRSFEQYKNAVQNGESFSLGKSLKQNFGTGKNTNISQEFDNSIAQKTIELKTAEAKARELNALAIEEESKARRLSASAEAMDAAGDGFQAKFIEQEAIAHEVNADALLKEAAAETASAKARTKEIATLELEKKAAQGSIIAKIRLGAADFAATVKARGLTLALKEQIAAWLGIEAATVPYLVAIVAVVAALGGLAYILSKIGQSGSLDDLSNKLSSAAEESKKASDGYRKIGETIEDLSSKRETLDSLAEGTREWKEAVIELNNATLDLLNNYPELWNYAKVNNGIIEVSEEGYNKVLEEQQNRAERATANQMARQLQLTTGQNNQKQYWIDQIRKGESVDIAKQNLGISSNVTGEELVNVLDAIEENIQLSNEIAKENYSLYASEDKAVQNILKNTVSTDYSLGDQYLKEQGITLESAAMDKVKEFLRTEGGYSQEQIDDLGDDKESIRNAAKEVANAIALEIKTKEIESIMNNLSSGNAFKSLLEGNDVQEDSVINALDKLKKEYPEFADILQQTADKELEILENTKKEANEKLGKLFGDSDNKYSTSDEKRENYKRNVKGRGLSEQNLNTILDIELELPESSRKNFEEKIGNIFDSLLPEQKNAIANILSSYDFSSGITFKQLEDISYEFEQLGYNIPLVELQQLENCFIGFANSIDLTSEQLKNGTDIINDINSRDSEQNKTLSEDQYKQLSEIFSNEFMSKNFAQDFKGEWIYLGDSINGLKDALNQKVTDVQSGSGMVNKVSMTQAGTPEFDQISAAVNAQFSETEGATEKYNKLLEEQEEKISKLSKTEQEKIRTDKKNIASLKAQAVRLAENSNRYKKLGKTIADNTKTLKDGIKGSDEYNKSLKAIASDMTDAFNTEITSDFVENHKKDILAMAAGDEEAFNRVSDAVKENIYNEIAEITGASVDNVKDIMSDLDDIDPTIDIKSDFDAGGVTAAIMGLFGIKSMAELTAEKVDEINGLMDGLGYEMVFEEIGEETLDSVNIASPSQAQYLNAKGTGDYKKGQGYQSVTVKKYGWHWKKTGGGDFSDITTGATTSNSGNDGGGGGSKSKPEKWSSDYDKYYNLLQRINQTIRDREKLERNYDKILQRRNTTYQSIKKNIEAQMAANNKQIRQEKKLISGRKEQIRNRMNNKKKISYEAGGDRKETNMKRFAWYDFETGNVQIDREEIKKVKDKTSGEKIEKYISDLEKWASDINEGKVKIDELEANNVELRQTGKEEYGSLEERVFDALVNKREKAIEKLENINDSINSANEKLISTLNENIEKQRQQRENEKKEEEISNKEQRLRYLQMDTSGSNQVEILSLQKELDQQKEDYTDTLIDQKISALEEQNEKARLQREEQIKLAQANLDKAISSGDIAKETQEIIENGIAPNGEFRKSLNNLLKDNEDWGKMTDFQKAQWNEENDNIGALVEYFLDNKIYKGKEIIKNNVASSGQSVSFSNNGETYKGTVTSDGKVRYGSKEYDLKYNDQTGNFYVSNKTDISKAKGKLYSMGVIKDFKTFKKDKKKVKKLQEALNDMKSDGVIGGSKIKETGDYSEGTKKAVKRLQKALGVKETGNYGKTTSEELRKNPKYKKYKTGGLANYTGPAWLDGTPTNPELVLNAKDTKNFMALTNTLRSLTSPSASQSNISSNCNITVNVDKISNDYDVDKMTERIKKNLYKDAIYRNVNSIGRLR